MEDGKLTIKSKFVEKFKIHGNDFIKHDFGLILLQLTPLVVSFGHLDFKYSVIASLLVDDSELPFVDHLHKLKVMFELASYLVDPFSLSEMLFDQDHLEAKYDNPALASLQIIDKCFCYGKLIKQYHDINSDDYRECCLGQFINPHLKPINDLILINNAINKKALEKWKRAFLDLDPETDYNDNN